MNGKDWDWTIEATDTGFYFLEIQCIEVFGGGRYTLEETQKAGEEFNKNDNPSIPRTHEEGRSLIEEIKIKSGIKHNS